MCVMSFPCRHGDIDPHDPRRYLCLHPQHRGTWHRVDGVTHIGWSDLHAAVQGEGFGGAKDLRRRDHPNLFHAAGLSYYRERNKRWRPYPNAPVDWACTPAYAPVTVAVTYDMLKAHGVPESLLEAILAEVRANHRPETPKPPKPENRQRIFLHGDNHPTTPDLFFCHYHNAWHHDNGSLHTPLDADIFHVRKLRTVDGRKTYRPAGAPNIWTPLPKGTRRGRIGGRSTKDLYACVAHDWPVVLDARADGSNDPPTCANADPPLDPKSL